MGQLNELPKDYWERQARFREALKKLNKKRAGER